MTESGEAPLDILYYSMTTWDGITGRAKQVATRLGSVGRVCFVDPITPSLPGNVLRWVRGENTRPWRTRLEQQGKGLWVLTSAPAFPFGFDLAACDRINQGLLARLTRRVARQLGLVNPVLWLEHPLEVYQIAHLHHRMVCYHCRDNYAAFWQHVPRRQRLVMRLEDEILSKADVVIAASNMLAQRLGQKHPNVQAVPNAADYTHMIKGAEEPSPELAGLEGPIIGYLGTISHWLDLDAIYQVAQRRPGWTFVLVGPVENLDIGPYRNLTNLRFLSPVAYDRVPAIINGFDVCLLPRKPTDLTRCMDPIKVYEYLSLGKPVVASVMPQLRRYKDLVYQASGAAQFESRIERALAEAEQEDAWELREARREVARANTWQQRMDQILSTLRQVDRKLGHTPNY